MTVEAEYIAAFEAAKGYKPTIERRGDRFAITTKRGSVEGYSEKEVRNLTCALRVWAGAR